ncbi:MAG: hypothetical protein ACK5U8_29260, partial [Deltaproteobacteria bacterium]
MNLSPLRRSSRFATVAFLTAATFTGCGRTRLDTFADGAPGIPDAAVVDTGRIDAGRIDAGPTDSGGGCSGDEECSNGIFCDGAETCRGGVCLPGTPVACEDGIDCTNDRCSEAARACESIPDSTRCAEGICDPASGGCVVRRCATPAECDDGVFCNGAEECV